jgi:acyl-CoA thioesterase YciA
MDLITAHLCKTSNLGAHGNLFGGKMLAWLDEAGAILAAKVCQTKDLVTLKFNEVLFHSPVKENNDVNIYGEVVKIGRTSITIKLVAKRYDVYDKTEEEVCSVTAVFVRISRNGKPRPIDLEIRQQYEKLETSNKGS